MWYDGTNMACVYYTGCLTDAWKMAFRLRAKVLQRTNLHFRGCECRLSEGLYPTGELYS